MASFNAMSILQCGQAILVPMTWAGNSIWPRQKKQDLFRFSGLRRLKACLQCGQGIFRPRLRSSKRMSTPHAGQDIFKNASAPISRPCFRSHKHMLPLPTNSQPKTKSNSTAMVFAEIPENEVSMSALPAFKAGCFRVYSQRSRP